MVLFDFKSDKHFVASSDKITIHVYELTNLTIHPSRIRKTHWREVASITPAPDHQDGGDDDEEEEESYNGLMFFDGHGKIEGQEALTKLAQHLTRLRLIVSPQGQSFQDVAELGEHKEFGIHYLRLNDLFNWPDHGVNMASVTTWPRIVLKYTITKREKRPMMNEGVSKEKYEELKKMVSQKDKALEKLKEEMKEQDREIQTLKEEREDASERQEAELRELEEEKDEVLRKLLKKKDDELQMLKRRKDKEIQMLEEEKENASEQQEAELQELEKKKNEELRDLMKRKDDELQNLETMMNDELRILKREKDDGAKLSKEKDDELKTMRDEVENLRKANKGDEAGAAAKKGKILVNTDEWHKLKKDEAEMRQEVMKNDEEMKRRLKKEKEENEVLQKLMNKKDAESEKLRKEKEETMRANATETRKLRDQLSQVHEVERRRTQSWALTGATRFLGEYVVDVRTRRPVTQDTWHNIRIEVPRDHYYVYEPSTNRSSSPFPMRNWLVVDEESKDWPSPPKVGVHCQPAGQFDKANWWFVKSFHPDGRLAMVAYYDGNQTSYADPNYLYPVRLPFPRNSKVYTTVPFFLVPANGGNRLAFMYRD
ncbi:unnamed protein product [Linum tenue]|uniref:Uncharacterized protein n=1 Tax=Linum tenue TaxID=586396 RepID=A0AAV0L3R7_9ROSI|nr:unnamed protein product [Linum tenue]